VSLYLDSSALLKRYVDEADSADCDQILAADASWITGRHTWIEVIRNLARLLTGPEQARLLRAFRSDWNRISVVELDLDPVRRYFGEAGALPLVDEGRNESSN